MSNLDDELNFVVIIIRVLHAIYYSLYYERYINNQKINLIGALMDNWSNINILIYILRSWFVNEKLQTVYSMVSKFF